MRLAGGWGEESIEGEGGESYSYRNVNYPSILTPPCRPKCSRPRVIMLHSTTLYHMSQGPHLDKILHSQLGTGLFTISSRTTQTCGHLPLTSPPQENPRWVCLPISASSHAWRQPLRDRRENGNLRAGTSNDDSTRGKNPCDGWWGFSIKHSLIFTAYQGFLFSQKSVFSRVYTANGTMRYDRHFYWLFETVLFWRLAGFPQSYVPLYVCSSSD